MRVQYMKPFVLFTLAVALRGPNLLQAQFNLGTLRGTISDPNGAAVANCQVTITSNSEGSVRQTVTNGTGSYSVPSLQAGLYTISAQTPGFAQVEAEVTVAVDKTANVDLQLRLGNLSQKVEVTDAVSPIAVEKDTHEIATIVSTKDFQNLPSNGRNFLILRLSGWERRQRKTRLSVQVDRPRTSAL
jgi:hypothetical protein